VIEAYQDTRLVRESRRSSETIRHEPSSAEPQ
jgi:hypothetical protein